MAYASSTTSPFQGASSLPTRSAPASRAALAPTTLNAAPGSMYTAGAAGSATTGEEEHEKNTTTFYRSCSISVNEPVGSMSISPANRDVVLAARKGLFIVDLENPYDPPRFLAHSSRWEVADCQWNPHPARAHWVASTSNQKLLVWNLDRPESQNAPPALPVVAPFPSSLSLRGLSGGTGTTMASLSSHGRQAGTAPPARISRSSAVEHVLHAHGRGITDINWSPFHPDVLASCGLDTWTWAWDLRSPERPKAGYSAWNAAATQVKWNRASPHRLATSCDNKVLIWDDRKGALPLATIEAHESKIYSIDWSRDTSLGMDRLITCSLDGSVKYWDLASPAAQAAVGRRELVTQPEAVIETRTPVWRARHLPFGNGVMTLPQRGDTSLSMWAKDKPDEPVERFVGHRDIVKEYLFRTRGGSDREHDDRAWQLLTWSKDQTLRLWPVSEEATRAVGHRPGGKITVLYTRANARDISYRDPPSASTAAHTGHGQRTKSEGATPGTSSSILPPTDATWSLLSGRGSGTRLSPTSPYGSSAVGSGGALSTSLSHSNAASLHKHAKSFSELANADPNWQQPLSRSAGGSLAPAFVPASIRQGSSFNSHGHAGSQIAGGSATMSTGSRALGVMQGAASYRSKGTAERRRKGKARDTGGEKEKKPHGKRREKAAAAAAPVGFMTRGAGARTEQWMPHASKGGAAVDPVGWISGVRMQPEARRARKPGAAGTNDGSTTGGARGMSSSRATIMQSNVAMSDSHSELGNTDSESREGNEAPDAAQTLGEEVLSVSKHVGRVVFEKIEIAQRTCTCSLYGPWGADRGQPAFLRVTFSYPSAYPSKAPRFELEHNASVSLKTRAFLLRNLSAILSEHALMLVEQQAQESEDDDSDAGINTPVRRGEPSMEACLRFLLGETIGSDTASGTAGVAPPLVDDTDDEDVAATLPLLRVPPRTSGASFGANGQLVVFAPVKRALHARVLAPTLGQRSQAGSLIGAGSVAGGSTTGEGARFLHSYSALSNAMASLASLAKQGGMGDAGVEDLDVVQLMQDSFMSRRLLQRSDSKGAASGSRRRRERAPHSDAAVRARSTSPFPRSMPANLSAVAVHMQHALSSTGSTGSVGMAPATSSVVRIVNVGALDPLPMPPFNRRRSSSMPTSPTILTPTNERRDPLAAIRPAPGSPRSRRTSRASAQGRPPNIAATAPPTRTWSPVE